MFQIMLLFVLSGCVSDDPPKLPFLNVPSQAQVLRESFQGPGPERTGNWRGWFDRRGCWWEEHNTWLVVSDPVLLRSRESPLHWNAVRPDEPWFCLTGEQRTMLAETIDQIPQRGLDTPFTQPVDRWTIVGRNGHVRSAVIPRDSDGEGWAPMLETFRQLAAMSVWGQSQESI